MFYGCCRTVMYNALSLIIVVEYKVLCIMFDNCFIIIMCNALYLMTVVKVFILKNFLSPLSFCELLKN